MATHLERLIASIATMRREAVRLSGRDHEPADCATILKDAGGILETFLKAHVYLGRTRGTFEALIDDLASLGVSPQDRNALHILRRRYNAAKHDPAYAPSVDEVVEALAGSHGVVKSWQGRAIGQTEVTAAPTYRRRVWVASWDHYVHGDAEVSTFLPVDEAECDFPPSLDIMFLKGLAWPDVVKPLGVAVRPANGLVPAKFLDLWRSEGDFAGAIVFEGEYRDLVRALATEELRLDLIEDLKRESDPTAMWTAVSLASVDAVQGLPAVPSREDLVDAILHHAATSYAAPRAARLVKHFAGQFADLLLQVPSGSCPTIKGPRFVTSDRFRRLAQDALVSDKGALVTRDHELILLLGDQRQ